MTIMSIVNAILPDIAIRMACRVAGTSVSL